MGRTRGIDIGFKTPLMDHFKKTNTDDYRRQMI